MKIGLSYVRRWPVTWLDDLRCEHNRVVRLFGLDLTSEDFEKLHEALDRIDEAERRAGGGW